MATRLKIVDVNGRETTLSISHIVEIDGKPYGATNDPALSDRVRILEAVVADLVNFKDALLEAKPEPPPKPRKKPS